MRRPVTSVLAIAVAVIAAGCGGAARVATPPAAVAATTSPSSTVPVSLMGRVVTRMPTTSKVVALTFDGGANADGAASILATLQRKQVPATFFLTGNFATTFPTISRRLAAWGRLGNHTVSHPHTTRLSAASVRWQIWRARQMITTVTGENPKPWFRFPFGEYDARTLRIVNAWDWVAIGWTVDSRGWMGTANGNTAAAVANRVVAARTPGAIVLMHLGSHPTDHSTLDAAALPTVIDRLRSYGYRFVTMDRLLR